MLVYDTIRLLYHIQIMYFSSKGRDVDSEVLGLGTFLCVLIVSFLEILLLKQGLYPSHLIGLL